MYELFTNIKQTKTQHDGYECRPGARWSASVQAPDQLFTVSVTLSLLLNLFPHV